MLKAGFEKSLNIKNWKSRSLDMMVNYELLSVQLQSDQSLIAWRFMDSLEFNIFEAGN